MNYWNMNEEVKEVFTSCGFEILTDTSAYFSCGISHKGGHVGWNITDKGLLKIDFMPNIRKNFRIRCSCGNLEVLTNKINEAKSLM